MQITTKITSFNKFYVIASSSSYMVAFRTMY